MRIGIDVGMDLHCYIISCKDLTELISDLYTLGNLEQHTLPDLVSTFFALAVYKHKPAFLFTEKYNNRCEFCGPAKYL
ncbi:hypothetical protein D3C87_1910890 [compost metagenome]